MGERIVQNDGIEAWIAHWNRIKSLDLAPSRGKGNVPLKERDWKSTESRRDALDLAPVTNRRLRPNPEKRSEIPEPEPRKLTLTLKAPPRVDFTEPGITLAAEHFIATEDVSAWLSFRLTEIEAGRSRLLVGHVDFFAVPPSAP